MPAETYGSGLIPQIGDTERMLMVKEVLATIGGGGGGGGGVGLVGHGSPENVVTAIPGTSYFDLDTDNFWYKKTGTGNTGWVELIG